MAKVSRLNAYLMCRSEVRVNHHSCVPTRMTYTYKQTGQSVDKQTGQSVDKQMDSVLTNTLDRLLTNTTDRVLTNMMQTYFTLT